MRCRTFRARPPPNSAPGIRRAAVAMHGILRVAQNDIALMTAILYLLTAAALLGIAHACVTRLTRGAALVLLLLPLVFTGRALLTGRVYAPVELAYTTEPLSSCAAEIGAPEPQNRML